MATLGEHVNWRIKGWWHARIAARVLKTPPAVPRDDGVVIFSMTGTRVLAPYLVAAKSLHRQLGRGRFVVMDDGSLTDADWAVLAHHLGDPLVIGLHAIDTGDCPRGGTWERLLAILDQRATDYVIQLDSDTVTLGPVPEIADAIAAGRSFTLLGDAAAGEMGVLAAEDFVARHRADRVGGSPDHVQAGIERAMDAIAIPDLRYIRGCSGFAGFAPATAGRRLAERFSAEAERLLGRDKWSEWGSEQVTSNIVIANDPDPLALPYARYTNHWDRGLGAGAVFAHFIGTYRYHGRAYIDATRTAITALG